MTQNNRLQSVLLHLGSLFPLSLLLLYALLIRTAGLSDHTVPYKPTYLLSDPLRHMYYDGCLPLGLSFEHWRSSSLKRKSTESPNQVAEQTVSGSGHLVALRWCGSLFHLHRLNGPWSGSVSTSCRRRACRRGDAVPESPWRLRELLLGSAWESLRLLPSSSSSCPEHACNNICDLNEVKIRHTYYLLCRLREHTTGIGESFLCGEQPLHLKGIIIGSWKMLVVCHECN